MNLLIVGHVIHKRQGGKLFAYGPYVREINLWGKHVQKISLLVPFNANQLPDPIDLSYEHGNIVLEEVPQFNLTSAKEIVKTIGKFPTLWGRTWKAMRKADHIHLRCPGNMGLLGALVQIFFRTKTKSAKYAGNWDRSESKPFSYRLQQYILGSTLLSRKMQVLVYGDWEGETKNIRPFFTASYSKSELEPLIPRVLKRELPIRLIFAGGLVPGKQPILSAQVALKLIQCGLKVHLDFYGDGSERCRLESFVQDNDLVEFITIHGNVPPEALKRAYKSAHFLIFISESEGWPKVVAEAMFWGCLPVTTAVSCVPQMLGFGERGHLVNPDVEEVARVIEHYIQNPDEFGKKGLNAAQWSRQFTLERFQHELKGVLFD